jgi:hypothetical protein
MKTHRLIIVLPKYVGEDCQRYAIVQERYIYVQGKKERVRERETALVNNVKTLVMRFTRVIF